MFVNNGFTGVAARVAGRLFLSLFLAALCGAVVGGARAGEIPVVEELPVDGGDGDAWFLGVCLSRSGPNANKGGPCIEGIRQRLREINAAGGLSGKRFRLIVGDDRSTGEGAVAAAKLLIADDRILAVIGPQVSGIAQEVRDQVVNPAAKMIFVSPTATRDALVTADGWFFSALWPNSLQADAMARYFADNVKAKRGTVLVDPQSVYSVGLGERFSDAFRKRGGTVTNLRLPGDVPGELSLAAFEPVVKEVLATDPEFVYFPATAGNIRHFVRKAGQLGVPEKVVFGGGDTWDNSEIFVASGRRLAGSVITTPFFPGDPSERVVQFTRALAKNDIRVVSLDLAMGSDATTMVVEAMRLGGATRQGIREGWFKLRDVPLISGDTSVRADGSIDKDVLILRVTVGDKGYATELVDRVAVE